MLQLSYEEVFYNVGNEMKKILQFSKKLINRLTIEFIVFVVHILWILMTECLMKNPLEPLLKVDIKANTFMTYLWKRLYLITQIKRPFCIAMFYQHVAYDMDM